MNRVVVALILFVLASSANAQLTIPNADFEDHENIMWGLRDDPPDSAGIDPMAGKNGDAAFWIKRSQKHGISTVYQELPLSCDGVAMYQISALIKTKNVNSRFAGIGARVFDKNGNTICGSPALEVSGTHDWTLYSGQFYADKTTASVRIFCLLLGDGEVWFDKVDVLPVPLSTRAHTPAVQEYIEEYFDIAKKHWIGGDTAHVSNIQRNVMQLCAGYSDAESCRDVLKRYATLKLGDGHSFFSTAKEWKELTEQGNVGRYNLLNYATGQMLSDGIAYIKVPMFASFDEDTIAKYVDGIQQIIAKYDKPETKGWIIDLADNGGGNAFAMIAGLGPLLGDGVCGYSISGDGTAKERIHRNGWTGWDSLAVVVARTAYKLKHKAKSIAILQNNGTASAGEVAVISFAGLSNARSFGQGTAGATTRIDNFPMSDGSYFNIAAGIDADRTGKQYFGGIQPSHTTVTYNEALAEAIRWISMTVK